MKNIPNRIYLQVDPENEKPDFFTELLGITWCVDKINDNDIPYYRHKNKEKQMKITTLKDIDLSKYKLAHFKGNAMEHEITHEAMMEMAEKGVRKDELPELHIALIPKGERLTDCNGDDWDDAPASCNASGFYTFPEGTIFLTGRLGEELKLGGYYD